MRPAALLTKKEAAAAADTASGAAAGAGENDNQNSSCQANTSRKGAAKKKMGNKSAAAKQENKQGDRVQGAKLVLAADEQDLLPGADYIGASVPMVANRYVPLLLRRPDAGDADPAQAQLQAQQAGARLEESRLNDAGGPAEEDPLAGGFDWERDLADEEEHDQQAEAGETSSEEGDVVEANKEIEHDKEDERTDELAPERPGTTSSSRKVNNVKNKQGVQSGKQAALGAVNAGRKQKKQSGKDGGEKQAGAKKKSTSRARKQDYYSQFSWVRGAVELWPGSRAAEYEKLRMEVQEIMDLHGLWKTKQNGDISFALKDGKIILLRDASLKPKEICGAALDDIASLMPRTPIGSATRWFSVSANAALGVGFMLLQKLFAGFRLGGVHVGDGNYTPQGFALYGGSAVTDIDWGVLSHAVSIIERAPAGLSGGYYGTARMQARSVDIHKEKDWRHVEDRAIFAETARKAMAEELQEAAWSKRMNLLLAGNQGAISFHANVRLHTIAGVLRSKAGFFWRFGRQEAHAECVLWMLSELNAAESSWRSSNAGASNDAASSSSGDFYPSRQSGRAETVEQVEWYHSILKDSQQENNRKWRGPMALNAMALSSFISKSLSKVHENNYELTTRRLQIEERERIMLMEEEARFSNCEKSWAFRAYLRAQTLELDSTSENAEPLTAKSFAHPNWWKNKDSKKVVSGWFADAVAVCTQLRADREAAIAELEQKRSNLRGEIARRVESVEFWEEVADRTADIAAALPMRRLREFERSVVYDVSAEGDAPPLLDTTPRATYEDDLDCLGPELSSPAGRFLIRVLAKTKLERELRRASEPPVLPAIPLRDQMFVIFWSLGRPAGWVAFSVGSKLGEPVDLLHIVSNTDPNAPSVLYSFDSDLLPVSTWNFLWVRMRSHLPPQQQKTPGEEQKNTNDSSGCSTSTSSGGAERGRLQVEQEQVDKSRLLVEFEMVEPIARDKYLVPADCAALKQETGEVVEPRGKKEPTAESEKPGARVKPSERVIGGSVRNWINFIKAGRYCSAKAYLDSVRLYRKTLALSRRLRKARKATKKKQNDRAIRQKAVRMRRAGQQREERDGVGGADDGGRDDLAEEQVDDEDLPASWAAAWTALGDPKEAAAGEEMTQRELLGDEMAGESKMLVDLVAQDEHGGDEVQLELDAARGPDEHEDEQEATKVVRDYSYLLPDYVPTSLGQAGAQLLLEDEDEVGDHCSVRSERSTHSSEAAVLEDRTLLAPGEFIDDVKMDERPLQLANFFDSCDKKDAPSGEKNEPPTRHVDARGGATLFAVGENKRARLLGAASTSSRGDGMEVDEDEELFFLQQQTQDGDFFSDVKTEVLMNSASAQLPSSASCSSARQLPPLAPGDDDVVLDPVTGLPPRDEEEQTRRLRDEEAQGAELARLGEESLRDPFAPGVEPEKGATSAQIISRGSGFVAESDGSEKKAVVPETKQKPALSEKELREYRAMVQRMRTNANATIGGFEITFRGNANAWRGKKDKKGPQADMRSVGRTLIAKPMAGDPEGDTILQIHERRAGVAPEWLRCQKHAAQKQRDFQPGKKHVAEDYLLLWIANMRYVAQSPDVESVRNK
eukprot:g7068.t1